MRLAWAALSLGFALQSSFLEYVAAGASSVEAEDFHPGVFDVEDDTTCSLQENLWFIAKDHTEELKTFIAAWSGDRNLFCLDLFGASGNVVKPWSRNGFAAVSYDIKLHGRSDDIVSKRGFLNLIRIGLQLVDGALIVAGPPCSLYIFLSCSVHKRHELGPLGDTTNKKVRLSNAIAQNMATFLQLMHEAGRSVYCLLEQPASSWLFKVQFMVALLSLLGASWVTTWQAFFGHDMLKCTHLVGNLPGMCQMSRTMRRSDRAYFVKQFEEKQANRKVKKSYLKKDAKGGVSGGRDLAGAAAYPPKLCNTMFRLWVKAYRAKSVANN